MNFKLFCCLFLACTSMVMYPMESLNKKTALDKVVGSIAQSTIINEFRVKMTDGRAPEGEQVSEEIQKMWLEAQKDVGLQTEQYVPIRQKVSTNGHPAYAKMEAVYVHEKFNDDEELPYGYKRCILHHEAVHVKYNDDLVRRLIFLSGFVGGPLLTRIFNASKIFYPLSFVAGGFASYVAVKNYLKYFERRADIEGHYATQCSACVSEKINKDKEDADLFESEVFKEKFTPEQCALLEKTSKEREASVGEKYLLVNELEQIALDLQDKLCPYHQEAQNNSK